MFYAYITFSVCHLHEGLGDLFPAQVFGAIIFVEPAQEAAGYAASPGVALVAGIAVNAGRNQADLYMVIYKGALTWWRCLAH